MRRCGRHTETKRKSPPDVTTPAACLDSRRCVTAETREATTRPTGLVA